MRSKVASCSLSLVLLTLALGLAVPERAPALRCVCDTPFVTQYGWATSSSCAAAIADCQAYAESEAVYWTEPYGVCEWGVFSHGECYQSSSGQIHVDCSIEYKGRDCSPDSQG
jgi:hypothetical protein